MYKALAAASLGVALIATPAIAGDNEKNSVTIEFQDLNLNTPEGQEKLEQRIETAAREMCGIDETRTGTRLASSQSRRCLAEARQSAKKRMAQIVREQQLGG